MGRLAGLDPDVAYPPTERAVPESWGHAQARFLSYGSLRAHFKGRRDCFVAQDFSLYYRMGDNKTFVEPDLLVSFGVDRAAGERSASYRLWEMGAPAFVLEVASEGTAKRDRKEKPAIYLEVGAGEYWRFDPTGGNLHDPPLQGERLVGGAWVPIEVASDGDGLSGFSRSLGLHLHSDGRRLRFRDPRTGLWLSDPDETCRERDDANARATAAEDQAAAAEDARRAAEDRAAAAQAEAAAAEAEAAALRARLEDQNGDTPR